MKNLLKGPFSLLFLAQISSQIAANMMNFTLIIFVFEETLSNIAVSGIVVSFTLPAIFFGVLAGAYIDRRDKKSVLLITNIVRAGLLLVLVWVKTNLAWVFLLSFIISSITQFFIPAEASMIPRIVKKSQLLWANSLFTMTIFGSVFAGYILAGPILNFLGITKVFLLISLFYFLAAFFVTFLPRVGAQKEVTFADLNNINGKLGTLVRHFHEMYSFVQRAKNILWSIFMLTLSGTIIPVMGALFPGYAKTVLSLRPTDASLFLMAPAISGMIMGSLFLLRWGKDFPRERFINLGIILSGVLIFVLPFFSKTIVILLLFLLGVANSFIFVVSNETLQRETEKDMLGRVYGLLLVLQAAFSFFPVVIAGALADLFGVSMVLVLIGVIIILLGTVKVVRKYA